MDIRTVIETEAYTFLKTESHLGDNIIFLTLGGSHAYGTQIETSDIDIRGCVLPMKQDLIGFSKFEQFEDKATDTTIYSFNKLIQLLVNCNPNTIELLGSKPEHYTKVTPVGQALLDNQKMFLSQRAKDSFGGYATAQLRRLQNAVARDALPQERKEIHIRHSIESAIRSFEQRYTVLPEGALKVYIQASDKEELTSELFIDMQLKGYPLRDCKGMLSEMNEIIRLYGKLNHRNHKKDEVHLNKHAMHLVRLYLMAIDIFEKERICTYRGEDLALLMSIRKGIFMNADGTYQDTFFELVDTFEKRLSYAIKHTGLPEKPDMKCIEAFVMAVNERVIRGDS